MKALTGCKYCEREPQMRGCSDSHGSYVLTVHCVTGWCKAKGTGVAVTAVDLPEAAPLTDYTERAKNLWNEKQLRGDTTEC